MIARVALLLAILGSVPSRAGWESQGLGAGELFSIHVFESGIYLAGTAGLWKYSEAERSWACIAPGFVPLGMIETGTGLFAAAYIGGPYWPKVLRSRDGGLTWKPLGSGLGAEDSLLFSQTRYFARIGRYLIATASTGVFRSGDGGDHWERVDPAWADPYERMVGVLTHGTDILTVGERHIYCSADSGSKGSWVPAGSKPGNADGRFREMVSIGKYLLATLDVDYTDVTYRSSNGGLKWEILDSGRFLQLAAQGSNLYGIRYANHSMLISPDSGVTWSPGPDSLIGFGAHRDRVVARTMDAELIRSEDGGAVFAPLPPPGNMAVQDLATDGETILAGTEGGVYLSREEAAPSPSFRRSWERVLPFHSFYSLFMDGEQTLAHFYGRLFRSTDGGIGWTDLTASGAVDIFGGARRVLSLDGALFMIAPKCLYRSDDSGATWKCVHEGGGDYAPTPPLLRLGRTYFLGALDGAYRSSDSGRKWERASAGLAGNVLALASRGDTLFATGDGGVFRSVDRGDSWARRDKGDTGFSLLCTAGSALVAARKGFLSRSPDDGATWFPFLDGMIVAGDSSPVRISALSATSSHLFAGTIGTGLWVRPLSDAVSGTGMRPPADRHIPHEDGMRLVRAASVPGIAFVMGKPGRARLEAFGPRGERVAVLADAYFGAGRHSLPLPGPTSGPGIRIYVLRMGGRTFSLKAVSGL